MLENDSNAKKVVTDTGEQKVATVESFVEMAKDVLENTKPLESIPTPEDVKKSNEVWDEKYGDFEEKKASIEVTEIKGHPVKREIDSSEFNRYPHLVSGAKAYGYELDEVRLFEMEEGFFGVTTLAGEDIDKPKTLASGTYVVGGGEGTVNKASLEVLVSSGFVVLLEKVEEIIDTLQGLDIKIEDLSLEPREESALQGFLESRGEGKPKEPKTAGTPQPIKNVPTVQKEPQERSGSPLGYDIDTVVVDEEEEDGIEPETDTERGVITDYKAGVAVMDIREHYDISAGLLYTILNKHHVPLRSTGSPKGLAGAQVAKYIEDEDKRKQLVHAYTTGKMTLQDIYSAFGITKNGLFYILDMFAVPRRMPKRLQNVVV